jgi:hypothetical protein
MRAKSIYTTPRACYPAMAWPRGWGAAAAGLAFLARKAAVPGYWLSSACAIANSAPCGVRETAGGRGAEGNGRGAGRGRSNPRRE